MGVPGRSRAIETAERLGLPSKLLAQAKTYLSSEHFRLDEALKKLEQESLRAATLREELELLKRENVLLKNDLDGKLKLGAAKLLGQSKDQIQALIDRVSSEVRQTLSKIDETKSRKAIHDVRGEAIAQIMEVEQKIAKEIPETGPKKSKKKSDGPEEHDAEIEAPASHYQDGARVKIPKWKSSGIIIRAESESTFRVQMGAMQMVLNLNDLRPDFSAPQKSAKVRVESSGSESRLNSRLDLRGQRVEDALGETERYLDQILSRKLYSEITIVHGYGTGALRESVRKLLKSLPYVRAYRDADSSNGGTGATVVEFDL